MLGVGYCFLFRTSDTLINVSFFFSFFSQFLKINYYSMYSYLWPSVQVYEGLNFHLVFSDSRRKMIVLILRWAGQNHYLVNFRPAGVKING